MLLTLSNEALLCCAGRVLATAGEAVPCHTINLLHWLESRKRTERWYLMRDSRTLYIASIMQNAKSSSNTSETRTKTHKHNKHSMRIPLLLLDGLLSQCHVLHVLLQAVQWGVWLYTNPIIVVLGVPSEFKETTTLLNLHRTGRHWTCQCESRRG